MPPYLMKTAAIPLCLLLGAISAQALYLGPPAVYESSSEQAANLATSKRKLANLQKAFGDNFDIKDCLAITALQLSINNIAITRQNELETDDMKALDALSRRLDKHLNRLPRNKSAK